MLSVLLLLQMQIIVQPLGEDLLKLYARLPNHDLYEVMIWNHGTDRPRFTAAEVYPELRMHQFPVIGPNEANILLQSGSEWTAPSIIVRGTKFLAATIAVGAGAAASQQDPNRGPAIRFLGKVAIGSAAAVPLLDLVQNAAKAKVHEIPLGFIWPGDDRVIWMAPKGEPGSVVTCKVLGRKGAAAKSWLGK